MTGMTSSSSVSSAPVSREAVAEYLESGIASGKFGPGERLPSERHLAEELHVSRPIVREALRVLVERDLIEVRPGRGAFVRTTDSSSGAQRMDAVYRLSHVTPRDLVEARLMLECTAAKLAAARASETDLQQLEAAAEGCERAVTIVDRARYDLAFHLAVARAAHNPVIETMFRSISSLTIELMFRSLSDQAVVAESLPLHRAVVEAIRNQDPEAARAAMGDHLAVASRLYGDDFEASIKSVAQRELARLFSPDVSLDDLLRTVAQPRT
jgi:DNA-binding FadR family transcriptional regulator